MQNSKVNVFYFLGICAVFRLTTNCLRKCLGFVLVGVLAMPNVVHAGELMVDLTKVTSWNHASNQAKIAAELQYADMASHANSALNSGNISTNQSTSKKRGSSIYDPKINLAQSRLEVMLVRKLFNNTNQHVNGIEFDLSEYNFTFDDIDSLKLNLRVSKALSYLPIAPKSPHNIEHQFIDKLFSPRHHFAATFYGQFHHKIDVQTTYAKAFLSLEATESPSNVLIAAKDMSFYNSKNYRKSPLSAIDRSAKVYGLIITADTVGLTTLENLMNQSADFNNRFKNDELYIESYLQLNQLAINTPK